MKQREKEKRQKQIEKLNPGLGNKFSKEKALQKLEKESKLDKSGLTLLKVRIKSCLFDFRCRCSQPSIVCCLKKDEGSYSISVLV